jgi:hypothetical protein
MIRLTILYNLPPDADEAEFLRWRLGEHQQENASVPGVVRTDFSRIDEQWTLAGVQPRAPYRFMTVVDFPDRASFEAGLLSEEAQAKLRQDIKSIDAPLFLISEVLVLTD